MANEGLISSVLGRVAVRVTRTDDAPNLARAA